ncbi:hypothetical protein QYF36_016438 [Acer negundo]|nr:hypothetical protein QYF36_016438 [Acer negundo]
MSFGARKISSSGKRKVKESDRRQGHGEALLKGAIEKCRTRKVFRICLNVDSANTAAVNLYKKFGFQVDGLLHGYYSPDIHAYRMYCIVNQSGC